MLFVYVKGLKNCELHTYPYRLYPVPMYLRGEHMYAKKQQWKDLPHLVFVPLQLKTTVML